MRADDNSKELNTRMRLVLQALDERGAKACQTLFGDCEENSPWRATSIAIEGE